MQSTQGWRVQTTALVVGGLMVAGGPSEGTELGRAGDAFLHAVDAGFRSKTQPVEGLECRAPASGRGIFDMFGSSTIFRSVSLAPVSGRSAAFNKSDHFRRFDGAVFELSICFEPPGRKDICIVKPVLRRNGALCVR